MTRFFGVMALVNVTGVLLLMGLEAPSGMVWPPLIGAVAAGVGYLLACARADNGGGR